MKNMPGVPLTEAQKSQLKVKSIRKFSGLSQQEFAILLDYKIGKIRDTEVERLKVSEEMAERIHDMFRINSNWLLFDHGAVVDSLGSNILINVKSGTGKNKTIKFSFYEFLNYYKAAYRARLAELGIEERVDENDNRNALNDVECKILEFVRRYETSAQLEIYRDLIQEYWDGVINYDDCQDEMIEAHSNLDKEKLEEITRTIPSLLYIEHNDNRLFRTQLQELGCKAKSSELWDEKLLEILSNKSIEELKEISDRIENLELSSKKRRKGRR